MNELFNLARSDFLSLFFIFIRIGTIFALVPFFNAEIVPRRVTTTIAFFLSLVLLPIVPPVQVKPEQLNILMFASIVLQQVLIGVALGLAIDVIYAGIQIAGELIGFQMGFSIANVVGPHERDHRPHHIECPVYHCFPAVLYPGRSPYAYKGYGGKLPYDSHR